LRLRLLGGRAKGGTAGNEFGTSVGYATIRMISEGRRLDWKDESDEVFSASVLQALGALEWLLAQVVFNTRARAAVGFQQYLASGIKIPESIIKSRKWCGAFNRAPSFANHRNGFGRLLRDRLIALGFEEDVVWNAMDGLEHDVLELCLDVESAVARELQRDLYRFGVHLPRSVVESSKWRSAFERDQRELPSGAASIVRDGTYNSVFQVVKKADALESMWHDVAS
jgi:hypothetical protein